MSKNTYPLKLPVSIKEAARELAAADGVSLNQFIAAAVAEKVGAMRTADKFLKARAEGATGAALLNALDNAPDVPPVEGDEPAP